MRLPAPFAEMSTPGAPTDRRVEQAIVALKKGAHLLKRGRRGKPKFCPFRLSTDETILIWYSGEEERQLKLNLVTKVILGQQTVNFLRQPQIGKACHSLSLIYQSGERTLDLICKDKEQAETWFLALEAIVSQSHHLQRIATTKHTEGVQTISVSPIRNTWRKDNGELLGNVTQFPQVQSLHGSPARSLLHRYASDVSSYSPAIYYSSRERTLSDVRVILDKMPHLSHVVYQGFKEGSREADQSKGHKPNNSVRANSSIQESSLLYEDNTLKDVFMWGEDVEGGILGGAVYGHDRSNLSCDALFPKLLECTEKLDVQKIFCGRKYVALVTKQGEVFTWGEEYGGRLGHKTNIDMSQPKLVESLAHAHVSAVACGANHACALTKSGEFYEWGDSYPCDDHKCDENRRSQWLPHRTLGVFCGICISKVACGDWHTAVVSSTGQLFTYGSGVFGVLGHGNTESISQPKEVISLKGLKVKSIACGPWHTAAIVETTARRSKCNTSSGKLFTWGDNDKGRLGHIEKEKKLSPMCVSSLADLDFLLVSCGITMTVALTVTGIVFTMGSTIHGQLGNPLAEDGAITTVEGVLTGEYVKEISSGSFHVAVLTTKGEIYTWGKGANGRLGVGDTEDRFSPTLVEFLKDRQVLGVVCGSSFTAAICLHRSILSSDQAVCHGCRLVFGFTRRKHNCYNCGLLFCHSCTSKKAMNASLAPNKNKLARVCDSCFNQMKTRPSSKLECKISSPRLPLLLQKRLSDLKMDGSEQISQTKIFSPKLNRLATSNTGLNIKIVSQNSKQQNAVPLLPDRVKRWGQVSCPQSFHAFEKNQSAYFHQMEGEVTKLSDVCHQEILFSSKHMTSSSASLKADCKDPEKALIEELQVLKDEVRSLTKKCEDKVRRLEMYKQQVAETLLLARNEAVKCKAAKDVIRALTAQVKAMSEESAMGRELHSLGSLIYGKHMHTPRPPSIQSNLPEDVKMAPTCYEAAILSNRRLSDSQHQHNQAHDSSMVAKKRLDNHRQTEPANLAPSHMIQKAQNPAKNEWVEQDEPGVYITFMVLPSGKKGLKRVRFSRKHFTEREAEIWWAQNQIKLHLKYDVEQVAHSITSKTNS